MVRPPVGGDADLVAGGQADRRGGPRPWPQGARTADLVVIQARNGSADVVAGRVSDTWWASWSPDGRWLLVDDWSRSRWLFVRADGSGRIVYPWLGANPRWCCPPSPDAGVEIPLC